VSSFCDYCGKKISWTHTFTEDGRGRIVVWYHIKPLLGRQHLVTPAAKVTAP
jgi:hypothetical protein